MVHNKKPGAVIYAVFYVVLYAVLYAVFYVVLYVVLYAVLYVVLYAVLYAGGGVSGKNDPRRKTKELDGGLKCYKKRLI